MVWQKAPVGLKQHQTMEKSSSVALATIKLHLSEGSRKAGRQAGGRMGGWVGRGGRAGGQTGRKASRQAYSQSEENSIELTISSNLLEAFRVVLKGPLGLIIPAKAPGLYCEAGF